MQIRDKVVVVTGGASGIGRALCERFAEEGARAVVVSDINSPGIETVCQQLAGQTRTLGVVTDVSREAEMPPSASQSGCQLPTAVVVSRFRCCVRRPCALR
jgi:NAD(P)-dependent dehydrogenase (short-subunit alcohol dehydrogenase family)